MNQTQNTSKPKSGETGKWLNVYALVENKKKLLQLWLTFYFAMFVYYIETSELIFTVPGLTGPCVVDNTAK